MKSALAVVVTVLAVAILIAGEPAPDFAIDWHAVQSRIAERWPAVRSLTYDAADDFVTIVVTDTTTSAQAGAASCATVFPVIHDAGSRALFAVYTESGEIVSSWNRCLAPPP